MYESMGHAWVTLSHSPPLLKKITSTGSVVQTEKESNHVHVRRYEIKVNKT